MPSLTNNEKMMMSVIDGNYSEVKRLLLEGANSNATSSCGKTSMHYITRSSQFDILQLLVEHGIDVNHKDENGDTAIYHAWSRGFAHAAEQMKKIGADPSISNNNGHAPCNPSAYYSDDGELIILKHIEL